MRAFVSHWQFDVYVAAALTKNAATYEPYPGEPHNCGIVRIPQDELDEKVLLCHQAGLRVAIHAIGEAIPGS